MDQDRIRNFSIIAHIDHGKSTLADRILQLTDTVSDREMRDQLLDSMELERERGITIKAQAVRVHWKGHELNLIDTPGHVDFTYEVSRSLQACEGALLVVDAAQGIEAQTLANAYLAIENDLEIVPVANKIDLPQADPDAAAAEVSRAAGRRRGRGAANLGEDRRRRRGRPRRASSSAFPPRGRPGAPARALIFDSSYDQYRGVIAFVRVVDGRFESGEALRAMALGTAVRGGGARLHVAGPGVRCAALDAGEVGYVVTGLKDVSRLRVGDTLTSRRRGATAPLPGYKDVKPMVFAGLFPTDSDDYPELRDALEKLKLNDASLFYEPETSQALGFGFRCGFLGLLHMEIVRERLEREFDLDLLVTAPNVAYRVERRGGGVVEVHNPAEMPREVERVEEPYVQAAVIVPKDYVGAVMELCNERRGRFDHMEYLSENRVLLSYELPLGEIVVDFYDQLKSRTRGYASFDYDVAGFREGRPVARRRPRRRRAGRRALADRPPRRRVRAGQAAGRAAEGGDPAADVRHRHPGGDRLPRDRARDRQGEAQGRAREVLRRRHHPQAEAAREAEEGQEADEERRRRRGATGGLPGSAQSRRVAEVDVSGANELRGEARGGGRGRRVEHLYVHLPFCAHRCGYCDFVTVVGRRDEHHAYVDALLRELERERSLLAEPLATIFLGGGTPTLRGRASARAPARRAPPSGRGDGRGESRDGDAGARCARYATRSVTRISLGAQSFQPRLLAVLERNAGPDDVRRAVHTLRDASFDNISLDLMYGIPGQSASDLERDLAEALALAPDHLSAYELEAKPGTRFTHRHGSELARQAEAMEGYFELAVERPRSGRLPLVRDGEFLPRPGSCGRQGPPRPTQPRLLARPRLPRPRHRRRLDRGRDAVAQRTPDCPAMSERCARVEPRPASTSRSTPTRAPASG